jgi:3-oxoadipate enol-lactonase
MPALDTANVRLHYQFSGSEDAPVLLFSNSLGTDLTMWDPQASALARDFRLLRYDGRGQGQSAVTPGPYSISQLADDVISLLGKLNLARVHFCGLSMGGMVGMSLAMRAPALLDKLVLCNTAPKIGTPEVWDARVQAVRKGGMAAVVESVLECWFTAGFRAESPPAVESTRQMLLRSPVEGYVACCAAVRDMDARETIANVRVPTLIISGAQDPVTPPHDGRYMEEKISGSLFQELPAAHLSNIEAAEAFTMGVCRFLKA